MRLAQSFRRLAAIVALIASIALVSAPSPTMGDSLYEVPAVAELTATIPASDFMQEVHSVCLMRTDTAGTQVDTRQVCYTTFKPDPPPSFPPPFYPPVHHIVSTGGYNPATGLFLVPLFDCFEVLPGFMAVRAGLSVQLDKGGGPASGAEVITFDITDPRNCENATDVVGSLDFTPPAFNNDEDGDGCTDYYELAENGKVGGLMDPFNPDDCNELMDTSGIYRILEVLEEAEGDPGSYHHCIAHVEEDAGDVTARVYCYVDTPGIPVNPQAGPASGDGLPGDPPPAPYGDVDDRQTELHGSVTGNRVQLSGCFDDRDGHAALGHVYMDWVQDDGTGDHTAYLYVEQTQQNCLNGTPHGDPVVANLQATKVAEAGEKHDSDRDGCPDESELSDTQASGGLRDPFNHWDYFNPTHDGLNRVDDILKVVKQYMIDKGNPAYTKNTDRTAVIGANPWDLGPPNGQQRVDDNLAAVKSYMHDCGTGQLISDDDFLPK